MQSVCLRKIEKERGKEEPDDNLRTKQPKHQEVESEKPLETSKHSECLPFLSFFTMLFVIVIVTNLEFQIIERVLFLYCDRRIKYWWSSLDSLLKKCNANALLFSGSAIFFEIPCVHIFYWILNSVHFIPKKYSCVVIPMGCIVPNLSSYCNLFGFCV